MHIADMPGDGRELVYNFKRIRTTVAHDVLLHCMCKCLDHKNRYYNNGVFLMKNTVVLFIYALAIVTTVSCGGKSSSSSSTAFKVQPGDVSTITPNLTGKGTSFNVTFGTNNYNPSTIDDYAIIISNVNNTGNVGIAFGTDPKSNRAFKVVIYFPSTFPPSTGTYSGTITVVENGIKYTDSTVNNITISDFSDPESDNVYTIDITINNNISGKSLTITSLSAYLVQ